MATQTCGTFPANYLQNLEYVSRRLLDIINSQILTPKFDSEIPFTDSCVPGTREDAKRLSCTTWVAIKDLLISTSDEPDNQGYLRTLERNIACIIDTESELGFGLRSQFERFLCIIRSIISRIDSIHCISKCEEVVGDLFCLLVQLLLQLISVVSKAATLIYFADCANNTGEKTTATFFECIACDFVNELCALEKLLPELSAIVVAFISCDMECCTPCYTASSAPVKNRPLCPPKMMHHPRPNPCHGHNGNGCNCSCDPGCKKN